MTPVRARTLCGSRTPMSGAGDRQPTADGRVGDGRVVRGHRRNHAGGSDRGERIRGLGECTTDRRRTSDCASPRNETQLPERLRTIAVIDALPHLRFRARISTASRASPLSAGSAIRAAVEGPGDVETARPVLAAGRRGLLWLRGATRSPAAGLGEQPAGWRGWRARNPLGAGQRQVVAGPPLRPPLGDAEGLLIAQIAQRLGRSPLTVKARFGMRPW
jgi:hypothetical protein